jgi:hypothetical protein
MVAPPVAAAKLSAATTTARSRAGAHHITQPPQQHDSSSSKGNPSPTETDTDLTYKGRPSSDGEEAPVSEMEAAMRKLVNFDRIDEPAEQHISS